MPSETAIETLIKETRHAFIIAKSDGVLDASEVIQIAAEACEKIQKLVIPGSEKKALLLHTLKKALDASGGIGNLPGFSDASESVKAAFEEQLLTGASAAVDMMLSVASGKFDLRKPSNWLACIPMCTNMAKSVMGGSKDAAVIEEANKYANKLVGKTTVDPVQIIDASVPTDTIVVAI